MILVRAKNQTEGICRLTPNISVSMIFYSYNNRERYPVNSIQSLTKGYFIMLHRTGFFAALLVWHSIALLNTGIISFAYAGQNSADQIQMQASGKIYGKITNVLEAGGYTYAEVDTGKEKVWAAATTTALNVGDMVSFTTEMPMQNFHSKAMNRDFPMIYFVNRFITGDASHADAATAIASSNGTNKSTSKAKAIEGISKVEDGNTIAEIHANKQEFNGKAIRVRGQVTKYNTNVMGKNWLHIRDSSTLDDLTITTANTAAIDEIVVVEGRLTLDRDFGYGYVYPLIVEDASVKKE